MARITDFLTNNMRMYKLHDLMLKEICGQYGLTLIEANVIKFLYNNPEKDTAADIVELRMLSKGNVSQAVESLMQKGFLVRKTDTEDRRRIHLSLLQTAKPITDEIEKQQKQFGEELLTGISEEELVLYERINDRIRSNTQNAMKRREAK